MSTSVEAREDGARREASSAPAATSSGVGAEDQRAPGAIGLVRPARGLVRVLYTSNPFYVLSADLVFAGLRVSFGTRGPGAQAWALASSLACYTLLLATAACVLIRLGRLWDDLRTLLLLIVMMFLAIAMSCDDPLAAAPRKGAIGCLAGLAFAVAVSEVVLGVIRLRLPGWYRAAYHAMLTLIFLYPVALLPLLGNPEDPSLQWALFGFAPASALAVAMLVPAARRGRDGVARNGSPWRWPLYPWSLFVVLAGGLCVRSWSLCVSFHYVEGSQSIFGAYFLIPIGMAAALVWLEIGIAGRRRGIAAAACVVPLVLVGLAMYGHRDEWLYRQFLERFPRTLGGSPAYLTILGALAFLAYARIRQVPGTLGLATVALVMLSIVGPRTDDFATLEWPRALPMATAGALLAATAWARGSSIRALLAAACLVIATARASIDLGTAALAWPIALHLAVAALMLIGVIFEDGPGWDARRAGTAALVLMGLDAATGTPRIWPAMPPDLVGWYPLLIAAWAGIFRLLTGDRRYLIAGGISVAAWMGHSGWQAYAQLRRVLVGLDQIAWGLLLFALAMAISLRKAGLWPRRAVKQFDPLLAGDDRTADRAGGLGVDDGP